jgi:hypothetical protein
MIDQSATRQGEGGLAMHWIEVVDASGRARLEARWCVTGAVGSATSAGSLAPMAAAPHAGHAA